MALDDFDEMYELQDSLKGSEPTKEGGLIGRLWSLVG